MFPIFSLTEDESEEVSQLHDSRRKWTLRSFAKRQNIDYLFISLSANVGDDFQPLFQKAWAAPTGE